MTRRGRRSAPVRAMVLAGVATLLAGASGCDITDPGDDVVAGKQAFVQRCGSCHALRRAGTTGVTGPNLDAAFSRAVQDGLGRSTIEGIVHRQIIQPARSAQLDPKTGRRAARMPANLVTGETAEDVAAYVASAVARPGEDSGLLATVGVQRSTRVARAENGQLEIPADPQGALAYTFGSARAQPGDLQITSPNESSVPHNIALEGEGVRELGPVVQNGGVSEIAVTVEAGEYTFFCSVPGHRQGGMEGELSVEE